MRRLLAVAALVACSGCVDIVGARFEDNRVVEREEKRFPVTGKPEVNLSTFDGSIEVRPWDKAEVEVVIEKRGPTKESLADLVVDATQEGGRVIVDVRQPKGQGWHIGPSPSARLIVSLPATTDLIAKSGDGSIDVERLAGRLELGSGDGSIRARDLSGDVNAHTGDGSIVLDGKFASLRARSGDGSVRIRAAAGSTTGGDWDVTTGDGSITLEIPDGFSGELDAHTGDGRVHLEDVNVDTGGSQTGRNSLRGRVGSGGRQIRLRTGDGSITLRR